MPRVIPFRVVIEPDALPEECSVVLRCPICGCGGVTQLPVAVYSGTVATICSATATHVVANQESETLATILQFLCEDGHTFGYRFTPIGGGTIAELVTAGPQEVSM